MAEIKIRKKRAVWPWILAIGILLLILVYYLFASDKFETRERQPNVDRMENGTGFMELEYLNGSPTVYILT